MLESLLPTQTHVLTLPDVADVARNLRRYPLLMVKEAKEHEVFPDGSRCALDAVNAYLTTGVLPVRNITCAPAKTPRRSG